MLAYSQVLCEVVARLCHSSDWGILRCGEILWHSDNTNSWLFDPKSLFETYLFQDKACHKSVTKSVDGVKVGIIGYVTPKTEFISKPGLAPFLPFWAMAVTSREIMNMIGSLCIQTILSYALGLFFPSFDNIILYKNRLFEMHCSIVAENFLLYREAYNKKCL